MTTIWVKAARASPGGNRSSAPASPVQRAQVGAIQSTR